MKVLKSSVTLLATLSLPVMAADKVTYVDHVLPVFRNACLNCHNPDKKKAGLDLTTYQGTMAGSENGPVVKPGQTDGSLLFKVCAQTEEPKMPPKGDKLSDAELGLLKNWIAGFALETGTSKPAQAAQNQVALAVVSLERPAGPPPMPGDLPLEPLVRPKSATAIMALAASPWAPLVAIGGQKQVILYNTELLQPCGILPFPEGFPQVIRFSRNGQLLLTGGGLGGKSGKVVLWNVLTGQRVGTVGNEVDQVIAADISPDHAFVALGGPTRVLKIYATKDGKLLHTIKKHTEWVTAVAFSPDGKYLASADRNGGVIIWEGATGKEYQALAGHKQGVTALAFMPGVLASASSDGKITLWNVKEGNEIKSWAAHNGGVESVDFSPDGRLVSSGRDRYAKAWDQTGKNLFTSVQFGDIALRAALTSERVVATDWTGSIRAFGLDGKLLADLTANPPPIAEQLAAAQKRLTEAEAALPTALKTLADAEAKLAEAKATAAQRAKEAQEASDQLKTSIPALEKQIADFKLSRENLVAARATAEKDAAAAATVVQEKERANAPNDAAKAEKDAKIAAHVEAGKKVEELDAQIRAVEGKLNVLKADAPKRMAELEKSAKEIAGQITTLNTTAPPTPSTPAPAKDEKRIAAAQKKLDEATAEIARRRDTRSKQAEGSAEYTKANEAVQSYKAELAKAEAELATAQEPVPAPAAPKPQLHPIVEAVAKARQAAEQASSQVAAARDETSRWTRAQSFMTVHRAELGFGELKAKLEELEATAKDALKPADQARARIAELTKTGEEGPTKLKEAESAVAQAIQAKAAAEKAVADAQALLSEKEKAATIDPKAVEAEVAAAGKKLDELNAEIARRREARAKTGEGTPEYQQANAAVQDLKPQIADAEKSVATAKAKLSSAQTKPAPSPEIVAAQEAIKKAQLESKLATDKVAPAEQSLAKLKASIEAAAKELAEMKQTTPQIVQAAKATKLQAERDAAALVKQVEKAKTEAQKVRADFNGKWGGTTGVKTASMTPRQHP